MQKIIRLSYLIDKMNIWIAKGSAILAFPILGITLYGIIMRYIFNMPPTWGWQALLLLFYPMALLSGGYVLLINGHVRLDLIYNRWNPKSQTTSDVATFFAFALFAIILAKTSWDMAWSSALLGESYSSYAFNGPIWPEKVVLALSTILLILQGLAFFIRNIFFLLTKRQIGKELVNS